MPATTDKPRTAKVTPITSAKGSPARTKPAGPPEELEDEELIERRMFGPGKLIGAIGLMVLALWFIYSAIGTPHIDGSGFIGAAIGFLVVAGLCYLAALIAEHLLHIHHRSILAWLGRCAASAGRGVERLLTSAYVRLGALLGPWFTAAVAWARERWERRHSPDDEDEGGEPAPGDDAGPPEEPGPMLTPADPAGTPVPAETEAGAPAPAESTDGDTTVTTATTAPEARRSGGRFGGRVPPEGRAMIAMIDDFTPMTDEELHEVLLGVAAFQHDLGVAMQELHERCTANSTRLGKGAMLATHDAADGIVDGAAAVVQASRSFEDYYRTISDEVAGGKELPRDGDFITGNSVGG